MDGCYYGENDCDYELWECKTCHQRFCSNHYHETAKGKNVECVACERTRKIKEMLDLPSQSVLEKIERLNELGKNNNTIRTIARYLECAITEMRRDCDKIPCYDYGIEAREIIDSIIGCPTHSNIDCQERFCVHRRKLRQEKKGG